MCQFRDLTVAVIGPVARHHPAASLPEDLGMHFTGNISYLPWHTPCFPVSPEISSASELGEAVTLQHQKEGASGEEHAVTLRD